MKDVWDSRAEAKRAAAERMVLAQQLNAVNTADSKHVEEPQFNVAQPKSSFDIAGMEYYFIEK